MIHVCSKQIEKEVVGFFEQRFGLNPSVFESYQLYTGPQGRIFLGPKSVPRKPTPVSVGLLIARKKQAIKPSTNILQVFGPQITKNILTLDKKTAEAFIRGEDIDPKTNLSQGYVLVKHKQYALGCGLLKNGTVKNMLPKAKRLPRIV